MDTRDQNGAVSSHWETFYAGRTVGQLEPPSQFAAFVIGEVSKGCLVVDIGCGSGRDSFFFASQGHPVVGVDASHAAVQHCQRTGTSTGSDAMFLCADVREKTLRDNLERAMTQGGANENLLFYSRFFLHAITEDAEDAVLELVRLLGNSRHTKLALEFRTKRDTTLPKTTAQHYRRFIDPLELFRKASQLRFSLDYFVEGFGYAKYRSDDAYVARCLFSL
jgi:SAM-dependent methyltransferase